MKIIVQLSLKMKEIVSLHFFKQKKMIILLKTMSKYHKIKKYQMNFHLYLLGKEDHLKVKVHLLLENEDQRNVNKMMNHQIKIHLIKNEFHLRLK